MVFHFLRLTWRDTEKKNGCRSTAGVTSPRKRQGSVCSLPPCGVGQSHMDPVSAVSHLECGRARFAPSPLAGEGWGGGGRELGVCGNPPPCPSPARGEGTLWHDRVLLRNPACRPAGSA